MNEKKNRMYVDEWVYVANVNRVKWSMCQSSEK